MHFANRRTRRKLFGSFAVLAFVFLIATIAQFTGKPSNPYRTAANTQPAPRAVFGESQPKPIELPRVEQESTRSRTEPSSAPSEDINRFLDRWKSTIVNRNVDGHTSLYAPKVEYFFLRRNVTRDAVRKEKARMMELYPNVNRYEISDVQVERATPTEAVLSLRKEWDMQGDRRFAGAERQKLKLRKIYGDWKIVSEQEAKVYWIKRG